MNVQLFRIDDRLIHGQVVIGWASFLKSKKIILCDDNVYENEWEKELYLSIVPEDLESEVLSIEKTADLLKNGNGNLAEAIIIVNGPKPIELLLDMGVPLQDINIGGIHFKEGRKPYLSYLYLDDSDIQSFKNCMSKGVHFNCLDVPDGKKLKLEKILH